MILLTGLLSLSCYTNIQSQDLAKAIRYTKSEQFDSADLVFDQLVKSEPNNSKVYFYYGENRILNYFADTISNSLITTANQAGELFKEGVRVNPADPLNYIGLAKLDYYLGNDSAAEHYRQQARDLLPPYKKISKIPNPKDYAFALAKIAESYIRWGLVDTSITIPLLNEAHMIDKTNPDIYLITGDTYMLLNDGSNAIRNYKQAQNYDPSSPTVNMKIGTIYNRGLNLMAAIPYFEAAINTDVNYAPAYRELGQLYSLAGKYDKSKNYYEKYLELTKGNIPAKIRYVNSLFYGKKYDDVVKNVEQIFEVDKTRTYLNRVAAYSYYEMEGSDMNKALFYIDNLFKNLAPENLVRKDYTYLAKILLKKNNGYLKMLQDSTKIDNEIDVASRNLSSAKSQDQAKYRNKIDSLTNRKELLKTDITRANAELDRAFNAYDKALEYNPKDVSLLSEIANAYYAFKRYEGAARTWEKLLDLGRNDVSNYMQIGRAYYMAQDYTKADSVFTAVTRKFPDNLQSYLMIARTYSQMDPDSKEGLAKPKFEIFLEKASVDSVTNSKEMAEAFGYFGYYYLKRENYPAAVYWYDRMINIDPDNKDNLVKGYVGKANISFMMSDLEKELSEKIPYFERSLSYYNKALEVDPNNQNVKSSIDYVTSVEKNTQAHINPNELKGVISNTSGQPIIGASIRVKDTAAETLTNVKGEFKFEIPMSSETLIISAKGYKTKEIPITKTRTYKVELEQQ